MVPTKCLEREYERNLIRVRVWIVHDLRRSLILDHHGHSFNSASLNGHAPARDSRRRSVLPATRKSFGQMASYTRSLEDASLPAGQRARSPFTNHRWVFIATTAAQIPFTVFRETEDELELERRRTVAVKHHGATNWRPGRGLHRCALENHLRVTSDRRVRMRGLEADFDHPLTSVIARPSPYMPAADLFLQTYLWMAVRGEVFWLKSDDDGVPMPRARRRNCGRCRRISSSRFLSV